MTVPQSKEAVTVTTLALLMLNLPFPVPPVIEKIVGLLLAVTVPITVPRVMFSGMLRLCPMLIPGRGR